MFCIIAGVFSAFTLELSDYWIDVIRYTSIATIWFGVVFPYWINYVHLRNGITSFIRKRPSKPGEVTLSSASPVMAYGVFLIKEAIPFGLLTDEEKFDHIVNHMSDTAWPDKIVWWRQLGWKGRAIVNAIALCISIVIWIL